MAPTTTSAMPMPRGRACRITASSGGAKTFDLSVVKWLGSNVGRTQRVTLTAMMSPAMENRPSWAKPVKLENSMALKPAMEVRTPRRNVGQMRASVRSGELPGAVCVKRYMA